jgi:death-on-curing protein
LRRLPGSSTARGILFFGLNGYDVEASEADVVAVVLKLAAGDLSERALAKWLREHLVAYPKS